VMAEILPVRNGLVKHRMYEGVEKQVG